MIADWNGKKVLVTGADGFIGSHLTDRLLREGARVRAYVLYNAFDTPGNLAELDPALKSELEIVMGDIRDGGRVAEAVIDQQIVFHLASLVGIPYSYLAPDSYVQTNIGGSLNVLNACRSAGVERLVHTSTSEVYGTAQYVPIDEAHPLQGQSPYSATKIGADMLALSYHRAFGVPVAIVRPFNTYGPRQSGRAVIAAVLAQLFCRTGQVRLGALHPTRDFNYVTDTVSGFLATAQCERAVGEVVNVGSGREVSIAELVGMLMKVTGIEAEVVSEESRRRPADSEVDRLLCDNTRAREWAGWGPAVSLEEGLGLTVEWYREHGLNPEYAV